MTTSDTALQPYTPAPLARAGAAADRAAAAASFADYREGLAQQTRLAHDDDLANFARYLRASGLDDSDPEALAREGDAWRGLSWGLVAGFVRWMANEGYAIATINRALSTVKAYARLAAQAGALDPDTLRMIQGVRGYSHKRGTELDKERERTRVGRKKAQWVKVTVEQARALKAQPNTPQGRRDALLMALLIDHGLRVGEVVQITVDGVDLKAGVFRFYRPKVHKTQIHRMTADTLRAARAYLEQDAPALGPLLRASAKSGQLTSVGMSARAIYGRVRALGCQIGVEGLGPHDLRHYWASAAARNGTAVKNLQDAGGWSSPAMPLRYVESARIANEGVKLDD